jgi:hypothetical protein
VARRDDESIRQLLSFMADVGITLDQLPKLQAVVRAAHAYGQARAYADAAAAVLDRWPSRGLAGHERQGAGIDGGDVAAFLEELARRRATEGRAA